MYWILITQGEEKDTRWVLTDVNVSVVVWFEWFSKENTYACASIFSQNVCVRLTEAAGAETHGRHEQPRGKPRPSPANFFHTPPYVSASAMHFTWTCLLIPASAQSYQKVRQRRGGSRCNSSPSPLPLSPALSAQRALAPRWER